MITVKRQLRPGVLCNPSLSVSFLTINFIQGPSRQLARKCRNQIQFCSVFLFPIQNWPWLCRTLCLLLYIDYLAWTQFDIFSSGLLVAGGPSQILVEVYVPSTGQQCRLPELPDRRVEHTMENKTVCGGVDYDNDNDTSTSCLTLTGDGWERTTKLLERR